MLMLNVKVPRYGHALLQRTHVQTFSELRHVDIDICYRIV